MYYSCIILLAHEPYVFIHTHTHTHTHTYTHTTHTHTHMLHSSVSFPVRPRYDDRVPGGGAVVVDAGMVEEVGEASSDEEGDDDEPIYDQPDEGNE